MLNNTLYRKNSFLSRMEYSSMGSNRSQRSVKLEDIENTNPQENSIIIEELEADESTKYSGNKKNNLVLPQIKHKTPQLKKIKNKPLQKNPPIFYYSIQFERNKLGSISTRVIKEQVNKIRKNWQSIASQMSEKGDFENTSTTGTPRNIGNYLNKVKKKKIHNKNHRYANTQRLLNKFSRNPNKSVRRRNLRKSLNKRA